MSLYESSAYLVGHYLGPKTWSRSASDPIVEDGSVSSPTLRSNMDFRGSSPKATSRASHMSVLVRPHVSVRGIKMMHGQVPLHAAPVAARSYGALQLKPTRGHAQA